MKKLLTTLGIAAATLSFATSFAQTPAAAPAGSTGLCKDGTYYSGATKSGACNGHKGVKQWFGAADSSPAPAASSQAQASTSSVQATKASASGTTAAAAGGGADQVWVNTSSKAYHCQNTKYYGKTKAGKYMTEVDAKAQGFHADHGKVCSK